MIKLWNVETGQEKLTLRGHDRKVQCVAFSPDSSTIVSGSDDETINLWDVESGQEKLTLKGHDSSVTCVSFSPDGSTIASGSMDKTIKLWVAERNAQPEQSLKIAPRQKVNTQRELGGVGL